MRRVLTWVLLWIASGIPAAVAVLVLCVNIRSSHGGPRHAGALALVALLFGFLASSFSRRAEKRGGLLVGVRPVSFRGRPLSAAATAALGVGAILSAAVGLLACVLVWLDGADTGLSMALVGWGTAVAFAFAVFVRTGAARD